MQRRIIILILSLLPATVVFSQPADCSKFREGKFRTADPRVGAIVVTDRRSGFQTESTEALKLVIRFSINWQDNCSYTLKLDKVIRNENKVDIPNNLTVIVKIVETAAGSYVQELSSSMTNGAYRTTVTKTE